jgi:hypothetical protein
VADDGGQRLEAAAIGFRAAHEDERGGAVGDRAGVCGGDRSAVAKGRLEVRNFVGSGFERELVVIDDPVGFAGCHRERNDFGRKLPSAVAFCARVRDASANSSCASRENA